MSDFSPTPATPVDLVAHLPATLGYFPDNCVVMAGFRAIDDADLSDGDDNSAPDATGSLNLPGTSKLAVSSVFALELGKLDTFLSDVSGQRAYSDPHGAHDKSDVAAHETATHIFDELSSADIAAAFIITDDPASDQATHCANRLFGLRVRGITDELEVHDLGSVFDLCWWVEGPRAGCDYRMVFASDAYADLPGGIDAYHIDEVDMLTINEHVSDFIHRDIAVANAVFSEEEMANRWLRGRLAAPDAQNPDIAAQQAKGIFPTLTREELAQVFLPLDFVDTDGNSVDGTTLHFDAATIAAFADEQTMQLEARAAHDTGVDDWDAFIQAVLEDSLMDTADETDAISDDVVDVASARIALAVDGIRKAGEVHMAHAIHTAHTNITRAVEDGLIHSRNDAVLPAHVVTGPDERAVTLDDVFSPVLTYDKDAFAALIDDLMVMLTYGHGRDICMGLALDNPSVYGTLWLWCAQNIELIGRGFTDEDVLAKMDDAQRNYTYSIGEITAEMYCNAVSLWAVAACAEGLDMHAIVAIEQGLRAFAIAWDGVEDHPATPLSTMAMLHSHGSIDEMLQTARSAAEDSSAYIVQLL
mgnify:CR=1 FL=1